MEILLINGKATDYRKESVAQPNGIDYNSLIHSLNIEDKRNKSNVDSKLPIIFNEGNNDFDTSSTKPAYQCDVPISQDTRWIGQ